MDIKRRCSRCRSHDLENIEQSAITHLATKPRDRAYLRRLQSKDMFTASLESPRAPGTVSNNRDTPQRKTFLRQKRMFRSPSEVCGDQDDDDIVVPRRVSRTHTELEAFFNNLGLEKSPERRLLMTPSISRNPSQSFSDFDLCGSFASLPSMESGSVFSGGARSDNCRRTARVDPTMPKLERNDTEQNAASGPRGAPVSLVERNARIVKWLCSVRRADSMRAQQP